MSILWDFWGDSDFRIPFPLVYIATDSVLVYVSKIEILSLWVKRHEWSSEWRKANVLLLMDSVLKSWTTVRMLLAKLVFEPLEGLNSQVKGTWQNTESKIQPETELSSALKTVQTHCSLKKEPVEVNDETTDRSEKQFLDLWIKNAE